MTTTYPSDLTDAEWACLQRHPPADLARRRWPRHSLRTVFDAVFYLLRTGCPWRYLPCDFPPWQTIGPGERTAEAIRGAVRGVLGDPTYRRNAERVRDAMATLPGPEYAAELLERLAAEKRPILAA